MSKSIALRSSTSARTSSQLTTLVRNVAQLRSQLNDAKRMVRLVSDTVTQVEVELKHNESKLAELTHERVGDDGPASTVSGLGAAALRGQEAVARWIEEGTLMASAEFAQAWGISRQALDQAVERGELFSMKLGNKRFYPRELLRLDRPTVARVCKALGEASAAEKLVFWLRQHGGLGGVSAVDAAVAGKTDRVVQLAQAWAEENGLAETTVNATATA